MTDKRIDAHTNTTTIADVDEFIVDSGSNGTRNITYTNLKTQILGSTSIATIGNSVTEAIYNTYTDIGDLTQTGVTGATVAAQISQLNDEIDVISTALNGKCNVISLGDISATSVTEALGKAWDSLTVYARPVLVAFGWYGVTMAMMYKYADSKYGMAIAIRYASTDIYTMSVSNGTKTYATK